MNEKEIKTLEQKTCGDTISRQAVINVFPSWKFVSYEAYLRSIAEIENIPTVTPKAENRTVDICCR